MLLVIRELKTKPMISKMAQTISNRFTRVRSSVFKRVANPVTKCRPERLFMPGQRSETAPVSLPTVTES
jgi:hypothetical protein